MSEWHWPQWVFAGLLSLQPILGLALDGKPKTGEWQFSTSLASALISAWLLWCGGFW